jgi:hypothetical protein
MSTWLVPFMITVGALGVVWYALGLTAFLTAALLVVLEVTLSFDNAVVNAKVLSRMSRIWQRRFLTWGILVAVVLVRVVLPILIVAASVWASPLYIAHLALSDPAAYAHLLDEARYGIYAFGGIFLTMVALKYFFDEQKHLHWIRSVETALARWGRVESIEIGFSLALLACLAFFSPMHAATILLAGVIGLVLFIFIQGIASAFEVEDNAVAGTGLALFTYLNILDAAFSLDSVVGAFALTTQIPVIIVGLGVGAYVVREFTIYMVRRGTLAELVYIEHGAHWAILALAMVMFAALFYDVPEPLTGFIGLLFVGLAYWSSVRFKRA